MDSEMRLDLLERLFSGLVRFGPVTDINHAAHMARVKYDGENITSGWLFILDKKALKIDDKVLVLYLTGFNADGFILGVVG